MIEFIMKKKTFDQNFIKFKGLWSKKSSKEHYKIDLNRA